MTRERATYREGPTTSCRPPSSRSTRTPSPAPIPTATMRSTRDELRKFLARPPIDLTLDVTLSPEASGRATVRRGSRRGPAEGSPGPAARRRRRRVRHRHRYGSTSTSKTATPRPRRPAASSQQRFKAADANKDGYLEGKEQAAINAPQSPLAGLSEVIDRDGDGKIYLKELLDFADRQIEAARYAAGRDDGRPGPRDLRHPRPGPRPPARRP